MRFLIVLFFVINAAQASPSRYSKYFEVDLQAPLPTQEELITEYITNDPQHDRKYDQYFLIGSTFDKIFAQTTKIYGTSEKRLKSENEDAIIEMLNSVPKESWQYIGPYLHTVAGMSEKVLNMPGIKETKNKFPTRVAKQLQGLEDLEFLSPHMYFILMPEIWPDNDSSFEYVIKPQKTFTPKLKYDPNFFQALKALVPPGEFFDDSHKNKITEDDLRTINIQPNSPLTSGDVKAFAKTLPNIRAYANKGLKENFIAISNAGTLLDVYEAKNGTALPVNRLKDVVNPCQREVQKIIIAGKYDEFLEVVGKQGFSPETWAVTCDKTIKAYRVATMPVQILVALRQYKNGIYDEYILKNLSQKNQGVHFATLESIIQMHKTTMKDVLSARKNADLLSKEFLKSENMILTSPIIN